MQNSKLTCGILFVLLLLGTLPLHAQKYDTLRLNYNHILILQDTLLFGIQDSVVILPDTAYYKVVKNWFIRDSLYYKKHPNRKKNAVALYAEYEKFIRSQAANKPKATKKFNAADTYFNPYEGYKIRNIDYVRVDLFEGSVHDTSLRSNSGYSKALDRSHIHTRKWVIKSNVQFKTDDDLNPRIMSDNERLLRNLPYIEDAKIYVQIVDSTLNLIDVMVVTKDKFPIGVGGAIYDYDYFRIEPYTRNLVGLGHNLGGTLLYRGDKDPQFGYGLNYTIDNIKQTFTHYKLAYENNYKQERYLAQLEKPFYTTNTRFGGELTFTQLSQERGTKFYTPDSVYEIHNDFTLQHYDTYLGVSVFFSEDLTKPHLKLAGRYFREDYLDRPEIRQDSNFSFHDKEMYLGSIMLRKISYVKTVKLIGFGRVEDIPLGFNAKFTGGFYQTNFFRRYYGSFSAYASGLIRNKQIFVLSMGIGGFKAAEQYTDVVIGSKLTYYGPLIDLGRFELRNLASVSYNTLINPLYNIPINFGNQIRGLNQSEIYGLSTITTRYQPVFFSPYQLMGFKLSFNPFVDLGWISLTENVFDDNSFFIAYGLAASIKNESFTFPAFNLSVAYYPHWFDKEYKFSVQATFKDYRILELFTKAKPEILRSQDFY